MANPPRIVYTITDEAPALATVSFLPILRRFAAAARDGGGLRLAAKPHTELVN